MTNMNLVETVEPYHMTRAQRIGCGHGISIPNQRRLELQLEAATARKQR
jgi:hypothetical protein